MASDHQGYLWLGTENGLFRFSGQGFEAFGRRQGIAGLTILDLAIDPRGTLWIGTDENIYRWDGNEFHPASSTAIPISRENQLVAEDADSLLVVFQHRLFRMSHDSSGSHSALAPVLSDRLVAAIPALADISHVSITTAPDGQRRVWVATGQTLYSWPDTGAASSPWDGPITNAADAGLQPDFWYTLRYDSHGTLWTTGLRHIAALSAGSSRFQDRTLPNFDKESTRGHAPLVEDPYGRMMVPGDSGIARWNGSAWEFIDARNGFRTTHHVSGMVFDKSGSLWVGVRGDALYELPGYGLWQGWTTAQGLPSSDVWDIAAPPGNSVYIGTELGPAVMDQTSHHITPLFSQGRWKWGAMAALDRASGGKLLAVTVSGHLLLIDPASGAIIPIDRVPGFLVTAFADQAGNWYFSTDHGIFQLPAGEKPNSLRRLDDADRLLGNITDLEAGCQATDKSLWFVSSSRLFHSSTAGWSEISLQAMGNRRGTLRAIACGTDNSVWLTGGSSGAWNVALTSNGPVLHSIDMPPQLRDLPVLAAAVDTRGWLWLGSESGLAIWNGKEWRHLTQESGLLWDDVNEGALTAAPDGSIWVGTSNGLSHLLHPESIFQSSAIGISLARITRGAQQFAPASSLQLPWNEAPLEIQLASPPGPNRSQLTFRYRMTGLQEQWGELHSSDASFPALPPGNFTFQAQAINYDLNATSPILSLSVHILPPWWKSDWFYALSGLGFALAILAVLSIRVQINRARQRELEALVKLRTAELEASRETLRRQATCDGLTGLLNRTAVLKELDSAILRAQRESHSLVIALIDLDFFKSINDRKGHLVGDEALRQFAQKLQSAMRPYDRVGRYGGEEFLAILSQIPIDSMESRLKAFHATISGISIETQAETFILQCSLGAVSYSPSDPEFPIEVLLARADSALYAAKATGRNRVRVWSGDSGSTPAP